MEIIGKNIILKYFDEEEWHDFWKTYTPDPIIDPRPYEYDYNRCKTSWKYSEKRKDWYPSIGIFLKDGTSIGLFNYRRINYQTSLVELGITMKNDDYKDKGYGTETLKLAIKNVFDNLNLNKIHVDTMSTNDRMIHILKKLAFKRVAISENHYNIDGKIIERFDYLLTREEYLENINIYEI